MHNLKYQHKDDIVRNFSSGIYPLPLNIDNKLKSSNIFINSFIDTEYEDKFNDLISKFNKDSIIWGIRDINGKLEWELYFYNNTVDQIKSQKIVSEIFDLPTLIELPKQFMWSFDINDKNEKRVDYYFINKIPLHPENLMSSGTGYTYDGKNIEFKNTYYSWNTTLDSLKKIKEQILNCSPFNVNLNIDDVLLPEIVDYYSSNENTITYINTSNKRDSDSVYYSGLDISMLIFCLHKFNYPKKQINFLEDNKDKFNHLLYDFGFNYKMNNNKLEIIKSGYYGQI
tara:strand:+ start:799 stop:1650 length:852 start_codon:yes stop_codon:yes gene_type:complete